MHRCDACKHLAQGLIELVSLLLILKMLGVGDRLAELPRHPYDKFPGGFWVTLAKLKQPLFSPFIILNTKFSKEALPAAALHKYLLHLEECRVS